MAQASIIKDKQGDIIEVDNVSGAIATENQWQALLESGKLFTVSHVELAVTNATSLFALITVGAIPIHIGFRAEGTGETDIRVREGVVASGNGTPLVSVNRNRASAITSSTALFIAPTITTAGTIMLDEILALAGARETRDGFEFILAASTNYTIELNNISGGNEDVALVVDWFEDPSLV